MWSPWASHPYAYCGNNPIAFVDPLGLFGITDSINYVKGVVSGIGSSLYSIGLAVINNPGTTMAFVAGAIALPNAALIAGAGFAGASLVSSLNTFIQKAIKGKDTSRAFGSVLVDSAFFFLAAKNVPKAVQGLKASLSGLTQQIRNLKSLLRGAKSLSNLANKFDSNLIENVIRSSREMKGQITQGARAIDKKLGHAKAKGYQSSFEGIAVDQSNAEKLISEILTSPASATFGNKTVDVYNALGQGVRFDRATNKFLGFLEFSLSTR